MYSKRQTAHARVEKRRQYVDVSMSTGARFSSAPAPSAPGSRRATRRRRERNRRRTEVQASTRESKHQAKQKYEARGVHKAAMRRTRQRPRMRRPRRATARAQLPPRAGSCSARAGSCEIAHVPRRARVRPLPLATAASFSQRPPKALCAAAAPRHKNSAAQALTTSFARFLGGLMILISQRKAC